MGEACSTLKILVRKLEGKDNFGYLSMVEMIILK
jgi:hypothetical protein